MSTAVQIVADYRVDRIDPRDNGQCAGEVDGRVYALAQNESMRHLRAIGIGSGYHSPGIDPVGRAGH